MLGFSIYLDEGLSGVKEKYIQQMAQAGFTHVFTSIHIPEDPQEKILAHLSQLVKLTKSLKLSLIADTSKQQLKNLGLNNPEEIKKLGISGLRVDDGFSMTEIAQLSQRLEISLNASTITQNDVDQLQTFGANMSQMVAFHNYYPRPETGLGEKDFCRKNQWLRDLGWQVAAFASGDGQKRGPLFASLPTLEKSRYQHPLAQALQLLDDGVDIVYIGDPDLQLFTQQQFAAYFKDQLLMLRGNYFGKLEKNSGLTQEQQNRFDAAELVIRCSGGRRLEKIPPKNTVARKFGAITIDNQLYQRYNGELQICKFDLPADEKVNVVGEIFPADLDLLTVLKPGGHFKIIFEEGE
ncbi:MupG family TIM beta-alpha barrel fold protein [Enterococcus timonensis]|uniref:MupG family TIM beta-alpha barrel fold protein n=1 Tax=Enterococcus timonensis TaxID=1852364 RepID=UPI0008D92FBE|nr:MupG family TIM beta-alpha barrel fold protein [Enterococcus timonensis]